MIHLRHHVASVVRKSSTFAIAPTLLLVFIAMASKDILGTIGVVFVVHGQGWMGGIFDGLADVGAALSIGLDAVVTAKNGWSWVTLAGFVTLFVASLVGTGLGVMIQGALPK